MVSTSIVTTQFVERRERSRFGISPGYSSYATHHSNRSNSLPTANRTSFSSVTPSFLTIDEYSSTRPAAPVQISTQSIVLEGGGTNESTAHKSDFPIHHLRQASLSNSQKYRDSTTNRHVTIAEHSSAEENDADNTTNSHQNTTNNSSNDQSSLSNIYSKTSNVNISKNDSITDNHNITTSSYGRAGLTTSLPSLISTQNIASNYYPNYSKTENTTFNSTSSYHPSVSNQYHSSTMEDRFETLRASKPTSDRIYDSEHDSKRNTALSKSTNLIAFVGAQAFNVGEQFETLQADESLSNLDRDEVIAIVVGNADLTTDQLYCFNNLQMILPLNSSYSSQLFTDSRICVEHIMAKEWITDKADTTMALILNLFRRPLKSTGNDEQRWLAGRKAIAHSVLGIVGLGRVGLAVLDRARRFQFDVVFYDPGVQARTEDALGVKRASSLRSLLEMSDCITLHCPLNNTTKNMINSDAIYEMKKGCFLVNTSNPQLVDSRSLSTALSTGRIGAAAFDYFDSSLDGKWNCLLGPRDTIIEQDQKERLLQELAKLRRRF